MRMRILRGFLEEVIPPPPEMETEMVPRHRIKKICIYIIYVIYFWSCSQRDLNGRERLDRMRDFIFFFFSVWSDSRLIFFLSMLLQIISQQFSQYYKTKNKTRRVYSLVEETNTLAIHMLFH